MPVIENIHTVLSTREFENLKSGDKVRVIPFWNSNSGQNLDGYMDKYLGCVVTISKHNSLASLLRIVEDDGNWSWNRHCFCEIIRHKEYKPASEEALALLYA